MADDRLDPPDNRGMLLAGDIGGTKTDLAIFSPRQGPRTPLAQARFHSPDYTGLEFIAREFLEHSKLPVKWACFDVAGPVIGKRAELTNLPWVVDAGHLRETLKLDGVLLLNDLEAIATAVPTLTADDLVTLNVGQPVPNGPIGIVAPGTGLGEAFLTSTGSGYQAHASEGGHASFAPTSPLQIELLQFLLTRFDHVSIERVCSGIGLPNLYDFFASGQGQLHLAEIPKVEADLGRTTDRTPIIVQAGLGDFGESERCKATLDLFAAILAAETGDLALKVMATGGMFLAGGLPPRILAILRQEAFLRAFERKGRLSQLVTKIPVHVVVIRVELMGSAIAGLALAASANRAQVN